MSEPKDIIIDAIRVLRSRRVRPSFAKIAWYTRREFLQSEEATQKILNDLVESGDITQVFYKGGNSYRVASNKHRKQHKLMSGKSSNKLSLHTSSDVIRPLLNAIAACGSCATKDRIAVKLIEADQAVIVDRLDVLLQKESRVGIIGRKTVFVGGRTLPAYFLTRSAPTSLLNKNYSSSPDSSPSGKKEMRMSSSPKRTPAPFEHLQQQIKKLQQEKEGKDSDSSSLEDSLPKEVDDKITADEAMQESEYQKLLEESPSCKTPTDRPSTRRGRPRKAPIMYEDVTAFAPARRGRPPKTNNPPPKPRPSLAKRGRRPCEPGNDPSARKRCSPPETPLCSGSCNTCGQSGTVQDQLLTCHRCSNKAHPSCLGYSAKLADRSRLGPWTCMDCKLCEICYMDHTVGTLIFCDECDRAFHLTCHQPALDEQPLGTWICFLCCPNQGPNVYEYLQHGLPTPRDSPVFDDESRGSCGSWEQRSFDPTIPNAAPWDIEKVVEYFNDKGFQEYSNAFKEHEIDGTALLMLTRLDVLTSLGFLLGPALHIYKEIRILQTRNPDPPLP